MYLKCLIVFSISTFRTDHSTFRTLDVKMKGLKNPSASCGGGGTGGWGGVNSEGSPDIKVDFS